MQYAPAPVGLIPVELDIEGIYEDHDRRRKKNAGNEKAVSSHVHSVSLSSDDSSCTKLILPSVAEPKTEPRKERSEIEKKNTCENLSSV